MMALQILLLLEVIAILCIESSLAYAVYGTKRYGRSPIHRINAPNWVPYQTMLRTQRHPLNYYLYPYSQSYPDDYYYPQESYPVYYPPARTSKYEVYQAVLPYYYGDRPITKPGYGYYGYDNDPVVDLQEEMMQEAEREEREESQPIGHELLYENDDNENNEDTLDDVNAAFLQNLIMSQMYKDAIGNQKDYYDSSDYYLGDDSYGKWEDMQDNSKSSSYQEDEDVRELKQLAKPHNKQNKIPDDIHWFQRSNFRNQKAKPLYNDKRSNNIDKNTLAHGLADRKSVIKSNVGSTSTNLPPITEEPKRNVRGQKEEVLMRPATPVKHPFSGPVLEMMTKNEAEKKRTPSVYDTIKHMLDMEKSLENKYGVDEIRPHMKKRIISSEESLTHQLSVLKKSQ